MSPTVTTWAKARRVACVSFLHRKNVLIFNQVVIKKTNHHLCPVAGRHHRPLPLVPRVTLGVVILAHIHIPSGILVAGNDRDTTPCKSQLSVHLEKNHKTYHSASHPKQYAAMPMLHPWAPPKSLLY